MSIALPDMITINQHFNVDSIPETEVEKRTISIIEDSGHLKVLNKNHRVAVGVGSRGIANLRETVSGVCKAIKKTGARPFIFPAMGSHGGGTSQGQADVLASLGIHRDSMNTEVISDATGILAGHTEEGIPVYLDKNALEADYVIVINRIKPHTKFEGAVESGICKMLSVGIGKVQGATAVEMLNSGITGTVQTPGC